MAVFSIKACRDVKAIRIPDTLLKSMWDLCQGGLL